MYIDGKAYEADPGKNMLQVVLDHKLDLPYFCWHPAMGSIGACRICAVKSFKGEADTKGKIVMACMTPAAEGTRISITDKDAADFRRNVIEWLMINHPHDCPVCDEGGECHLQDMTLKTGHVYRRYWFPKRTYENQDLGPFVTHEMNRCIQCYRCVRFYKDHAGGKDLDVFATKNHVYFGRQQSGVLESEFSGNLVDVCPTGVFDDKTLSRHYTRKWDLQTAPSVCIHCGIGCNTIPAERYCELRRIRPRYNSDVNGYFMCDRGRYGYEFVNDPRRIRECSVQADGNALPVSWDEAMDRVAAVIARSRGIVGIGSPRASLESNYALLKLVGRENFSTGLSEYEHQGARLALRILREGPVRTPSLTEVENADVVLVLGADPTNEAPMLDYYIRQAMRRAPLDISRKLKIPDWDAQAVAVALQGRQGTMYTITPWRLKLEGITTEAYFADYSETARMANEIRDLLGSEGQDDLTHRIAGALRNARQPLVVTSISAGTEVLRAAAELVWALQDAGRAPWLTITVPEANTMGVSMIGGMSADEAARRIESGTADTLVILENDLSRRMSRDRLGALLEKARNVILLDCMMSDLSDMSDIMLPTRAYVEDDGTFVNNEGRAQRFYQVFIPRGEQRPAWKVLGDLSVSRWNTYEDVLHEMAAYVPALASAVEAAPPADWRSSAGQKIAREPHRFSGRTAKDADRTVFEPSTPPDPSTPFAFTMEGEQRPVPGPLVPRFWWPGWNSENSVTKFAQEVNGPLFGGNSGKRLIEPGSGRADLGGEAVQDGDGKVLVIPRQHIFGSEELSRFSPGIIQLSLKPYIAMSTETAERLGVGDGQPVEFDAGGETRWLPVRIDESVPADTAVVPANMQQTKGIVMPAKAAVRVMSDK